jgi:hypothetical protein
MFHAVLTDAQVGLLMKDGRAVRFLEAGRHRFFSFSARFELVTFDLDAGYAPLTPELARLMPPRLGAELVVDHGEVALVSVDGRPKVVLAPGRYVLFQARAHVTALVKSTQDLVSDVPKEFYALLPASHFITVLVKPFERALVYQDGPLARVLQPGAYALHVDQRQVRVVTVDLREREIPVAGQEVMTSDKVSLRMNIAVKLRVIDPVLFSEASVDPIAMLYSETQMVVRRYVGARSLDELFASRVDGSATMIAELGRRAALWGIEISQVDLKDLVLPGDMRAILNRVVEAEKQAQAAIIHRREEVAATRSLANTAKVLAESPVLMRLKELEAYKDLASRVGQVTLVVAPSDALAGLKLGS